MDSMSRQPFVVVGPVIGLVTDTTARILIEANQTCTVICKLKPEKDGDIMTKCLHVTQGRPICFQFKRLLPKTYYKIRMNLPCPGLTKSGFTTMPSSWAFSEYCPRFAFVTGTSFTFVRDEIGDLADLWTQLLKSALRKKIDYIVHVGDNVYIDNDEYRHYKGNREFIGDTMDNAWQTATKYLNNVNKTTYYTFYDDVCELFRNCYRRTWNQKIIKQTLANVPNLMFPGEYDVRVGFGDLEQDSDPNSLEFFLASCAYRVFHEYQHNLYEDYPPSNKSCKFNSMAHKFYVIREIGILYTDIRYNTRIHREFAKSVATSGRVIFPLLGGTQLEAVKTALSPNGVFSNVKIIFTICPKPVCLTGTDTPNSIKEDLYIPKAGLWWYTENLFETTRLLDLLFEWKSKNPSREACLIATGTGQGFATTVYNNTYFDSDYGGVECIKQFSIGRIAAPIVSSYLKKLLVKSGQRIHKLGKQYLFQHDYISPQLRQFGIVDVVFENQKFDGISERNSHVKYSMQYIGISSDGNLDSSKPIDSEFRTPTYFNYNIFGCCGFEICDIILATPDTHRSKKKSCSNADCIIDNKRQHSYENYNRSNVNSKTNNRQSNEGQPFSLNINNKLIPQNNPVPLSVGPPEKRVQQYY